jgi:hypothetical protein
MNNKVTIGFVILMIGGWLGVIWGFYRALQFDAWLRKNHPDLYRRGLRFRMHYRWFAYRDLPHGEVRALYRRLVLQQLLITLILLLTGIIVVVTGI